MMEMDRAARNEFHEYLAAADLKGLLQAGGLPGGPGGLSEPEWLAVNWALGIQEPDGMPVLANHRPAAAAYLRIKSIAREREDCARLAEEAGQTGLAAKIRNQQPNPLEGIDPRYR